MGNLNNDLKITMVSCESPALRESLGRAPSSSLDCVLSFPLQFVAAAADKETQEMFDHLIFKTEEAAGTPKGGFPEAVANFKRAQLAVGGGWDTMMQDVADDGKRKGTRMTVIARYLTEMIFNSCFHFVCAQKRHPQQGWVLVPLVERKISSNGLLRNSTRHGFPSFYFSTESLGYVLKLYYGFGYKGFKTVGPIHTPARNQAWALVDQNWDRNLPTKGKHP